MAEGHLGHWPCFLLFSPPPPTFFPFLFFPLEARSWVSRGGGGGGGEAAGGWITLDVRVLNNGAGPRAFWMGAALVLWKSGEINSK